MSTKVPTPHRFCDGLLRRRADVVRRDGRGPDRLVEQLQSEEQVQFARGGEKFPHDEEGERSKSKVNEK